MNNLSRHIIRVWVLCLLSLLPRPMQALPTDYYAARSVLASGDWVKVKTVETGIHRITYAQLRQWGFDRPEAVNIYGYGGNVLPETFSENPPDDLPQISVWHSGDAVYFYALGNTRWQYNSSSAQYEHYQHPYSECTYYFLSETGEPMHVEPAETPAPATYYTDITDFDEYFLYEPENYSLGHTGRLFFADDFTYDLDREYDFRLEDATDRAITVAYSFGAKLERKGSQSSNATLYSYCNGTQYKTSNISTIADSHEFIRLVADSYNVPETDGTVKLRFQLVVNSNANLRRAALNYVRINYKRNLVLPQSGSLCFRFKRTGTNDRYILSGATSDTHIWDITSSLHPQSVETTDVGNTLRFVPTAEGLQYAAFNPDADLPTPEYAGTVANQNLHGEAIPDMVIITSTLLRPQAERIAEYHRTRDRMDVLLVEQEKIFNEFSSGTPDATAYRRLMKMFYDRATTEEERPGYLLLFGSGQYNNRKAVKLDGNDLLLLTYQSENGSDERFSHVVEDYFGFLEDGSGESLYTDRVCLGIGRIPATGTGAAQIAVDKFMRYVDSNDWATWQTEVGLMADQGDNGIHARQAETIDSIMTGRRAAAPRKEIIGRKIYVDAYKNTDGMCDDIRTLFRNGVGVFNYIGHAGTSGITKNGYWKASDMRRLEYDRLPVWLTVCCNFAGFDQPTSNPADQLFFHPNGGAIALITTTRVVYTDGNEKINRYLMQRMFQRDEENNLPRLGDVLRQAKLSFGKVSDKNKLNYILLGDPAMRINYPKNNVTVSRITTAGGNNAVNAGETVTVEGEITTPAGRRITDFCGSIGYTLYDSDTVRVTEKDTVRYYATPQRLLFGNDTVTDGRFRITFRMPRFTSGSNRPGKIVFYGYDARQNASANGYYDQFDIGPVSGRESELVPSGLAAPTIITAGIDSPGFSNGEQTGRSARFVCEVNAPAGFALSENATIGQRTTLLLDGKELTGTERYFRFTDGFENARIDYPLDNLADGTHTLTFRVWDNEARSAQTTLRFIVGDEPLYRIEVDEDPVFGQATIRIENEIDDRARIDLRIYDLAGNTIWQTTAGASSLPVVWNRTDGNGDKVPAGIYHVSALITDGEAHEAAQTKKIVVIGQ